MALLGFLLRGSPRRHSQESARAAVISRLAGQELNLGSLCGCGAGLSSFWAARPKALVPSQVLVEVCPQFLVRWPSPSEQAPVKNQGKYAPKMEENGQK